MNTVCIYEGSDHFLALAAREILEKEGLVVIMPTEHISGIMPHYALATAGHKLYVREDEAELAREILAGFSGGAEAEEEPFYRPEKRCPHCGSRDFTEIITPRRGIITALFLLFSVPVPAKKRYYRCHSCDNRWQ